MNHKPRSSQFASLFLITYSPRQSPSGVLGAEGGHFLRRPSRAPSAPYVEPLPNRCNRARELTRRRLWATNQHSPATAANARKLNLSHEVNMPYFSKRQNDSAIAGRL